MRVHLLMIAVLAATWDYSPANVHAVAKYDNLMMLVNDMSIYLQRCLVQVAKFTCPYLYSLNSYLASQSFLWLLFFQHTHLYEHVPGRVRLRFVSKRVRFVTEASTAQFVVIILLAALFTDVLPLSCSGELRLCKDEFSANMNRQFSLTL